MMKRWLIKASAPVCGTDTVYLAYCNIDPTELTEVADIIIEDLWDTYSWTLHLEDEEYDSEEEEQEAYDQAYDDWQCSCSMEAIEDPTDEEIQEVAPGGDVDAIEIVYDERS